MQNQMHIIVDGKYLLYTIVDFKQKSIPVLWASPPISTFRMCSDAAKLGCSKMETDTYLNYYACKEHFCDCKNIW